MVLVVSVSCVIYFSANIDAFFVTNYAMLFAEAQLPELGEKSHQFSFIVNKIRNLGGRSCTKPNSVEWEPIGYVLCLDKGFREL